MNLSTLLLGCSCPLPTEIADIPNVACRKEMGQLQRYFFVREGQVIWDSATPANNVPASIASEVIEDETGWDTLFAASDSTKVVKTPLIGGDPQIEAGAPITFGGGDNSTLNAETIFIGRNPSTFTGRFDTLDATQIAAMRALECESLEVYFVNNCDEIIACKEQGSDLITGFKISNFQLGTKGNTGGLTARDANQVSFELAANYDECVHFVTPNGWSPLAKV